MTKASPKTAILAAFMLLSLNTHAEGTAADKAVDTGDCVGIPIAGLGYFDSSRELPFKESQVVGVKFAGEGPGSYVAVYLAFPASGSDYDLGNVRDVTVVKADEQASGYPVCKQLPEGGARCGLTLPRGKLAVSVGFYGDLPGNIEMYQQKTLMAGKYAYEAMNCNAQGRHFDFEEYQKHHLSAQPL